MADPCRKDTHVIMKEGNIPSDYPHQTEPDIYNSGQETLHS